MENQIEETWKMTWKLRLCKRYAVVYLDGGHSCVPDTPSADGYHSDEGSGVGFKAARTGSYHTRDTLAHKL